MSVAMRPRFGLDVPMNHEEVISKLKTHASEPGSHCRVEVFYDTQVEIRIIREHHHMWSPQLILFLDSTEQKTKMRGKFGPDGQVWTMFMAGYATSAMLALGGLIVLSSQMMLRDQSPWGLWLIAASIAHTIFVYVVAQIGQRLATPQMELIHALICRSFPDDCTWSA